MFYNCTSLEKITIPDSVTKVGSNSFYGCTMLSEMTLGKGVIDIDTNFFTGCETLKTIKIAEGNPKFITDKSNTLILNTEEGPMEAGSILIRCLPGTDSVEIPDSVTIITSFAFMNCKNLKEIDLKNVTQIDEGAFSGCGMEKFETGDKVTTLGKNIFNKCDKLTTIKLGKLINEIDPTTLSGCDNLTKIEVDADNENYSSDDKGLLYDKKKTELLKCPQNLNTVAIPEDATLQTIGSHAFQKCKITSITIPNNIKTLKSHAFDGCEGLTGISLGDITTIEEYVINGCKNLTKVKLGKSIKYGPTESGISLLALQGCTSLEYIDVDTENTNLMSYNGILCSKGSSNAIVPTAILRCPYEFDFGEYGKYEIPSTVTSIGAYAFKDVSGLKHITLHDGIISIGDNAFSTKSLTIMELSGTGIPTFITNIEKISKKIFTDSNLDSIQLGEVNSGSKDVLDSISINFLNCKKLNVEVLESNETIPSNSFNACGSFKEIKFKEGVKNIGDYAFNWCSQLEEINLPTSIETIGKGSFKECTSLKKITSLPNLTSIGELAFYNCLKFEELDFTGSNNLKSIGNQSFRGLSNLKSLKFSNLEEIGGTTIADNVKMETLVLGDSLKKIGNYGIANNTSLKSVSLPASIITETKNGNNESKYTLNIGERAFQSCIQLSDVYFDVSCEVFGKAYDSTKNIFYNTSINGKIRCNDGIYEIK